MATNKVPLNVSHNEFGRYEGYKSNLDSSAFDMRNMNEETDRIKSRMREFEERCKKWREDFFNRQPTSGFIHPADQSFEQRVPTTTSGAHFNTAAADDSFFNANRGRPFASSLHKSYVEDTSDGGKKYRIEFDIGDFKPNELHLSTYGRTLVVKGDRELKAGAATETKTFNRELTLPEYVDINKMSASLLDNNATKDSINVLIIEAPVLLDKYGYRRSAYDQRSTSPTRGARNVSSPGFGVGVSINASPSSPSSPPPAPSGANQHSSSSSSKTTTFNPATGTTTTSQTSSHTEKKTSTTSTTHTTQRVVRGSGSDNDISSEHVIINSNRPISSSPSGGPFDRRSPYASTGFNQSIAPELINGYPIYDRHEGCVVYKFDLSGFDQNEIALTITADRTLEIKASKEQNDNLGKVYKEFKREIQLEPEVDANLIKNLLFEGILTLKIPKPNRPDGQGSLTNTHNLHAPNGFREIYTDDGKLAKLVTDFQGYNPENVKIVLSANNVLKVSAQQSETAPGGHVTTQRECSRQYTLPAWILPEQMKAIMSRDGLLTIDFTGSRSNIDAN